MFLNTKPHRSILITLKLNLIYCKKSAKFVIIPFKVEIENKLMHEWQKGVSTIWCSNVGN